MSSLREKAWWVRTLFPVMNRPDASVEVVLLEDAEAAVEAATAEPERVIAALRAAGTFFTFDIELGKQLADALELSERERKTAEQITDAVSGSAKEYNDRLRERIAELEQERDVLARALRLIRTWRRSSSFWLDIEREDLVSIDEEGADAEWVEAVRQVREALPLIEKENQ